MVHYFGINHLEIDGIGFFSPNCSTSAITFHSVLSTSFHLWRHPVSTRVRLSRLIRYARACRKYADFLYRARLLAISLLEQGYVATRLKFYCRHHELVDGHGVSICTMKTDLFNVLLISFPISTTPDLIFINYSVVVSRKAEDPYPTGFSGVRVAPLLLLLRMFYSGYFIFVVVCVFFSCIVLVLNFFFLFLLESWFP